MTGDKTGSFHVEHVKQRSALPKRFMQFCGLIKDLAPGTLFQSHIILNMNSYKLLES